MPTPEDGRPGLLTQVALVGSFSAGSPAWAAAGLLAAVGAVTAVAGPLLGHWSPSSTWLTMATATAFDLGVILALELR